MGIYTMPRPVMPAPERRVVVLPRPQTAAPERKVYAGPIVRAAFATDRTAFTLARIADKYSSWLHDDVRQLPPLAKHAPVTTPATTTAPALGLSLPDLADEPAADDRSDDTLAANDAIQTAPADARVQPSLALLIAAHNEAVVIASTLRSAIEGGMRPEDIYVVDDNSSDTTAAVARMLIPASNVLRVRRSGKGLALTKGSRRFKLTDRYDWIHIADADGAFAHNYFDVFRTSLRKEYAAATGYIRSLPGRNVSQYRLFEYTVGMELHRRFQSFLQVIPVIPGPTSCFRADVFATVNFANHSLTEDMDVTLQIHRRKLGKIQYIPAAVAYTQDPLTVKDFRKQVTRWNRGVMQGVRTHRIGRTLSPIDAYLSYQILQNLLFFANYCIWIPYVMVAHQNYNVLAATFIYDVLITLGITILVSARTGRWDVLSAFPIVYALRWVTLAISLKAFVEVLIMRKFRTTDGTWENNGVRRYAMPV